MGPLRRPGARGAALADEPEAVVAAEAQRAAQLGPRQGVHRAIDGRARRAAVGRYEKKPNCDVENRRSHGCSASPWQIRPKFKIKAPAEEGR